MEVTKMKWKNEEKLLKLERDRLKDIRKLHKIKEERAEIRKEINNLRKGSGQGFEANYNKFVNVMNYLQKILRINHNREFRPRYKESLIIDWNDLDKSDVIKKL